MKTVLYTIKTVKYKAIYDRMCNQGGWQSCRFCWLLFVDDNGEWLYDGMFDTKKELENHIGF